LQHKCIQGHLPVYPEPSALTKKSVSFVRPMFPLTSPKLLHRCPYLSYICQPPFDTAKIIFWPRATLRQPLAELASPPRPSLCLSSSIRSSVKRFSVFSPEERLLTPLNCLAQSAILDLNLTGALTDQKEGMEGALVTQLAPVQLQDLECEASPKMFSLPVIIVNPAASLQA